MAKFWFKRMLNDFVERWVTFKSKVKMSRNGSDIQKKKGGFLIPRQVNADLVSMFEWYFSLFIPLKKCEKNKKFKKKMKKSESAQRSRFLQFFSRIFFFSHLFKGINRELYLSFMLLHFETKTVFFIVFFTVFSFFHNCEKKLWKKLKNYEKTVIAVKKCS